MRKSEMIYTRVILEGTDMGRVEHNIYCNCCGKFICQESEKGKHSYLTVKKEWGYFSKEKDGKIYCVDICESCCEKLTASFAIPPEIYDVTEFV